MNIYINIINFRGVKNFTLEIHCNTVVSGANGSGKSTVYDAFLWCLTGTDRHGKDVNILPLPHIDNSPAGVTVSFGGAKFTREYSEKWTRKRGEGLPEFTGYQTTLYVDDIQIGGNDYAGRVALTFADTDLLQIVTNPESFFEMGWKTRRALIMKLTGVEQPMDFDGELQKAEKQRKLILKDQEEFPARIDELRRNYREIEGVNAEVIEEVKATIDLLQKRMATTPHHNEVAAANLDELIQVENAELMRVNALLTEVKIARNQSEKNVQFLENELEVLRNNYAETIKKQFVISTNCEACGQPLKAEKLQNESEFNLKKANDLKAIQEQGFKIKAAQEKEKENGEKLFDDFLKIENKEKICRLNLKELTVQKMNLFSLPNPAHAAIQEELKRAQGNLNELLAIQQQQHLNKGVFSRIEELERQLAAVNSEAAKKEAEIFALKNSQKEYINQVISKANDLFEGISFEMFREQINGAVADACDVYINGVSATTANNAARIYYSLVIADTLNIKRVPMFVDNAESCQTFPITSANQVRLTVGEEKELTVINI